MYEINENDVLADMSNHRLRLSSLSSLKLRVLRSILALHGGTAMCSDIHAYTTYTCISLHVIVVGSEKTIDAT